MGEAIAAVLLIVVVVVILSGALYWARNGNRQRRELAAAPALLLPDGEPPDVLLANARHMHSIAQRAIRLLDHLMDQPNAIPNNKDRKTANEIITEFYK